MLTSQPLVAATECVSPGLIRHCGVAKGALPGVSAILGNVQALGLAAWPRGWGVMAGEGWMEPCHVLLRSRRSNLEVERAPNKGELTCWPGERKPDWGKTLLILSPLESEGLGVEAIVEFISCRKGFQALCFDWLIWCLETFPFVGPVLATSQEHRNGLQGSA